MGKTSYKNTEKLIKDISKKVSDLENGELSIDMLNELVDNGKDLFERLVILRYKAFDKYGISEKESAANEVEKEPEVIENISTESIEKDVTEETPFDFTGLSSEKEQPSFDFTMNDEPSVSETPVATENTDSSDVKNEGVEKLQKLTPITNEDDKVDNSLNESLKQEDLTLRKKLQNSPIANIKSHISMAKKFEYIAIMFNGDAEAYEESIDFLNTCATGNDARLKLNELTTTHNWDLENKSIINFIELVERRYL